MSDPERYSELQRQLVAIDRAMRGNNIDLINLKKTLDSNTLDLKKAKAESASLKRRIDLLKYEAPVVSIEQFKNLQLTLSRCEELEEFIGIALMDTQDRIEDLEVTIKHIELKRQEIHNELFTFGEIYEFKK